MKQTADCAAEYGYMIVSEQTEQNLHIVDDGESEREGQGFRNFSPIHLSSS